MKIIITFVTHKSDTNLTTFVRKKKKELNLTTRIISERMSHSLGLGGLNVNSLMTTIRFFFRGERSLSSEKMQVLAEIFEVDVSELIRLDEHMPDSKKYQQIELDPSFDIRHSVSPLPAQVKTVSDLLLWLNCLQQKEKLSDG